MVELGYVDQSRDALDAKKTVWEEISGGYDVITLAKREMNSRAYVGAFNFKGPDAAEEGGPALGAASATASIWRRCSKAAPTSFCSTSRPTTSTSTRCARSRKRCSTSPGRAVIISHDRFFLDRIATHMLAFEGDSHVEWFEGNFADYEDDKKRRLGIDSVIPHRLKYKKFSRKGSRSGINKRARISPWPPSPLRPRDVGEPVIESRNRGARVLCFAVAHSANDVGGLGNYRLSWRAGCSRLLLGAFVEWRGDREPVRTRKGMPSVGEGDVTPVRPDIMDLNLIGPNEYIHALRLRTDR